MFAKQEAVTGPYRAIDPTLCSFILRFRRTSTSWNLGPSLEFLVNFRQTQEKGTVGAGKFPEDGYQISVALEEAQ